MRIHTIREIQPKASPYPFTLSVLLIYLFSPSIAIAQDDSTLKHESEMAIVEVSGNTNTQSLSGKQKTIYQKHENIYIAAARYLMSKEGHTETAKAWDASLRYERELTPHWSPFFQYGAESDKYGGYTQRDNIDVGGKYFFEKSEEKNIFSELGLRQSHTNFSNNQSDTDDLSGRLYVEYSEKLNASTSVTAWVEYLPNFDESNAWLLNYEPSLSVMLNKIFSLKVAYLGKYHNQIVSSEEKRLDTIFTTSLVAKF